MENASAESSAGGDGQYRLSEIPVGAARFGVLVEKRSEALKLVGVDQLEVNSCHRACNARDS